MTIFRAFHDFIAANMHSIQFSGLYILLVVSGFLGVIHTGAVFADGEISEAPYAVACIAVALFAVYKIGGM